MLLYSAWSQNVIVSSFFVFIISTLVVCDNGTMNLMIEDDNVIYSSSSPVDGSHSSIDDIITPSDQCKQIVGMFASAISNFTLCSVTNARPIHLCQWCIGPYREVVATHRNFLETVDDRGNPCEWYFTNLDRIEIVSDAYEYVDNLWTKGKCEYCFQKSQNASDPPKETHDLSEFDFNYELTKSCFDVYLDANETEFVCGNCSSLYEKLNSFYIQIGIKYGENVCLDIVDTMNTTRSIWSDTFKCVPDRKSELPLHIAMGVLMAVPILFYFLAFMTSKTTEATVLQQHRIAEIFSIVSNTSAVSPQATERAPPPSSASSGLSRRRTST